LQLQLQQKTRFADKLLDMASAFSSSFWPKLCGHEESNLSPNSYRLLSEVYSPAISKACRPGEKSVLLLLSPCRDDQRATLIAMFYPVKHPSELFEYQLQDPGLEAGGIF
jgi:hypothetical protein